MSSAEFDFKQYLADWKTRVEEALETVLPGGDAYPPSVHQAMRHSVFAGGKRIRPALCVAGCEALGGDAAKCLRTGAAIEMVHTYSLIHDDLPAMDDDDLRRGLPTCHKAFGEAVAILAGDALLTEAFGVIADDPGLSAGTKVDLISRFVRAAGVRGMVGGQVVDMEKEGSAFTKEDVEYIHYHKTSAMIELSVVAGAVIAGGSASEIDSFERYGRNIGLAFQIVDDVLNVTGGKDLGKARGTDAERGKATYPAIVGVDESRQKAKELCDDAARAMETYGDKALPLLALAELIYKRSN